MYVKANAYIQIIRKDGKKISFNSFNSIVIERDMDKINSSCKIKIPTSARLEYKATDRAESVQTSQQFARGDKIKVFLGYNSELISEFEGFIYRINYKSPLEIECEGYEFVLRSPCEAKTWSSTTLKEVLNYLCKGSEITLSDKIPDIKFTKFIIKANTTRLEALQMVKEKYGLTIFFTDKMLYAGLAYTLDLGTVKYKLGWNTIKDDELKYRNADDVRLKVKAVWIKPNNTKVEVQVGDPEGSQRTLFYYNVGSKQELEKLAKQDIQKYKYSGYEGKITTFLQPFAKPGMKAELSDPKYSERAGSYYITKTKLEAGLKGYRRTVEFRIKL
ncbi:hypothetical protein [Dysgonomonas sp. 520]|uniref:hypothetical protein n=1 Tax=Dysgonomonas sp. 520 TaxID=2302931 RepID=UPI0013D1A9BB|nr:hypothetical protein [Dysgonomonas sp. 520]NDW10447.1 hypothetical protein [Dysgonomonas sp. 520]